MSGNYVYVSTDKASFYRNWEGKKNIIKGKTEKVFYMKYA